MVRSVNAGEKLEDTIEFQINVLVKNIKTFI